MTRHADFCRWHPCERRFLDRRVTVATIDAEALDVMFMAERHGLDARHPGLGDVGRAIDGGQQPGQGRYEKHGAKNAQPGKGIGARMKDLRHQPHPVSWRLGRRLSPEGAQAPEHVHDTILSFLHTMSRKWLVFCRGGREHVFAEGMHTGGELTGVLAEQSQRHGGLTGEIGVGTPFSGGNVDEGLPDGVELLHGGAEIYTLYVEQGGFFEDLQVDIGGEHKHTSSRGKVELFTSRSARYNSAHMCRCQEEICVGPRGVVLPQRGVSKHADAVHRSGVSGHSAGGHPGSETVSLSCPTATDAEQAAGGAVNGWDGAAHQQKESAAIAYLQTPSAIRERCQQLLALACDDRLRHFAYHPAQLDATAAYVVDITRATYARLDIPWHSRWRHFQAGGVDRVAQLAQRLAGLDAEARARSAVELAITSVLLDAGAGERWCYREVSTGQTLSRSEGLAVASFQMFVDGVFSSRQEHPWQADAAGLQQITAATLAEAFQVSTHNPLVGWQGV